MSRTTLLARLQKLGRSDDRYIIFREEPGQTHTRQAGDIIIRRSYGADLRQNTTENDSSTHQGKALNPC
jgi:hypothetical protein